MARLTDIIAPSFYGVHHNIQDAGYTHYWLKGGRGSAKSSFAAVQIVFGLMQNPDANAVVIRKVGLYLKDSVYEQLLWAIDKLDVSHLWHSKLSPLEIIYLPTQQRILFRGADKPKKLKSTKVSKGYIRYVWYEEADEFNGIEEIRNINQSLLRGGDSFCVIYSYNPPKSQTNWVNRETLKESTDRLVHHSTYLTVPQDWLGKQFIIEAEYLKKTKPECYKHEYLGVVTGTGGEVFKNICIRFITDDEIHSFDRIKRGIDFGYSVDPFVYIACHYDKTRRRLYIFDEIYKTGLSNRNAAKLILAKTEYTGTIICDSAEPKSIDELRSCGIRAVGAKKGPDSVGFGIKFLQDLEEIVIDNNRCTNAAREFLGYELEVDQNGDFKAIYPDRNNHAIDAVRYALEDDMRNKKAKIRSKRELWL